MHRSTALFNLRDLEWLVILIVKSRAKGGTKGPSFSVHAEVAGHGGATGSDDLAGVSRLQSLGFQVAGSLYVGMVVCDFLPACCPALRPWEAATAMPALVRSQSRSAFELGESGPKEKVSG